MLRRKLFVLLGTLIGILLIGAVGALLTLHNLMLDVASTSLVVLEQTELTAEIAARLTTIETELIATRLQPARETAALGSASEDLGRAVERITPPAGTSTTKLVAATTALRLGIDEILRATPGPDRTARLDEGVQRALASRTALADLGYRSRDHTASQHARLMTRFRWTAAGLGLAYLLVINVTIMILIRAASMVLTPVDELVEATRHLAQEDFGHRARVHSRDEFGELARATNQLAEQLGANEQRKLETLQQVARTLSHELNNAIAIIDLQLELVGRRAAEDPSQTGSLEEIHRALERMSTTVGSLKRVRRIVLTDYIAGGAKMLDLERSVADEPAFSTPREST